MCEAIVFITNLEDEIDQVPQCNIYHYNEESSCKWQRNISLRIRVDKLIVEITFLSLQHVSWQTFSFRKHAKL